MVKANIVVSCNKDTAQRGLEKVINDAKSELEEVIRDEYKRAMVANNLITLFFVGECPSDLVVHEGRLIEVPIGDSFGINHIESFIAWADSTAAMSPAVSAIDITVGTSQEEYLVACLLRNYLEDELNVHVRLVGLEGKEIFPLSAKVVNSPSLVFLMGILDYYFAFNKYPDVEALKGHIFANWANTRANEDSEYRKWKGPDDRNFYQTLYSALRVLESKMLIRRHFLKEKGKDKIKSIEVTAFGKIVIMFSKEARYAISSEMQRQAGEETDSESDEELI